MLGIQAFPFAWTPCRSFAPVPIVSESVFPISCDLGVGFRASPDIALGFPGSVDWRMLSIPTEDGLWHTFTFL